MSDRHPPMNLRLERRASAPAWEYVLVACASSRGPDDPWTAAPGAVERRADGTPRRLHFAPRRWLLVEIDREMQQRLDAADAACIGVRIDVEGKWVAMTLAGRDARRALGSTLDIGAVLSGRDCAAVTLFDCPSIVAPAGDAFHVWVAASCADSFAAAIRRLAG